MAAYTLRGIPDDLWARVKARAQRDRSTIRDAFLLQLQLYADDAYAAGGRKAAKRMTADERRERARKAAAARWRR